MPLAEYLEGVSNSAGHHAAVKYREPCGKDRVNIGFFKNEHTHEHDDTCSKKLDTGHKHTVGIFRVESVDYHDVYGEEECAGKNEKVTGTSQ